MNEKRFIYQELILSIHIFRTNRRGIILKVLPLVFLYLLIFVPRACPVTTSVNVYPKSIPYWTGSTNGSVFTQSSQMRIQSQDTEQAWAKFDITSIPDGATINSVELHWYISSYSCPYFRIVKLQSDPVGNNAAAVYTNITTGLTYYSHGVCPSSGWNVKTLTGTAAADLQASLAQNWFAVGFHEYETSSGYYFLANGWNETNRPYLVVNYTYNVLNDIGISSVTAPVQPVCSGSQGTSVVLNNYGTNVLTSCTIKYWLNGYPQADHPWTGNLASGASTTVFLGSLNYPPGNIQIRACTSDPNGLTDPDHSNDTCLRLVYFTAYPTVSQQPVNCITYPGGTAAFSVAAVGASSYQWQVSSNGGSSWSDILTSAGPGGAIYSGFSTSSFQINQVSISIDGYLYKCVVKASGGYCNVNSDFALLNVNQNIQVVIGTVTGCPGSTSMVSVPLTVANLHNVDSIYMKIKYQTAGSQILYQNYLSPNPALSSGTLTVTGLAGTSSYRYILIQWKSGGTPVSISNGDTLIKLVLKYPVNATSNLTCSGTPPPFRFKDLTGTVIPALEPVAGKVSYAGPIILYNPANLTVNRDSCANFHVNVTGASLYLWQTSTDGSTWTNVPNASPYSGVNSASLHISSASSSMNNRRYRCQVTGPCATMNSASCFLYVIDTIRSTLVPVTVCPGQIDVPVMVRNFRGIASLSLAVAFNSGILTWVDVPPLHVPYLHPSVNGCLINLTGDTIRMAWMNTTAQASLDDDDTLVVFRFQYSQGNSYLDWVLHSYACQGCCQISNLEGTLLRTTFVNGEVIQAAPLVTNGPVDKTVLDGTEASFGIMIGGTPPFTYQWQRSADGGSTWDNLQNSGVYSGVCSDTLRISGVNLSMNSYFFRCRVGGACSMTAYSPVATLTVLPTYTIAGKVVYANVFSTPLPNVTVNVVDPGSEAVVATGITNADGDYSIPGVGNGTYRILCSSDQSWNGANSIDALLIMKHFVGLSSLQGIFLDAADVDGSEIVNAFDALMVMRRAVQAINAFPSGNWAFKEEQITVNYGNVIRNIEALCFGDVNGSFVPQN